MAQRCPKSKYLGIARISRYRWIINARGSANIISSSDRDVVWGVVYYLAPSDEAYLDAREHVPDNFTKEMLATDFWLSESAENTPFEAAAEGKIDVGKDPEKVDMLVYINWVRIAEDNARMNMWSE